MAVMQTAVGSNDGRLWYLKRCERETDTVVIGGLVFQIHSLLAIIIILLDFDVSFRPCNQQQAPTLGSSPWGVDSHKGPCGDLLAARHVWWHCRVTSRKTLLGSINIIKGTSFCITNHYEPFLIRTYPNYLQLLPCQSLWTPLLAIIIYYNIHNHYGFFIVLQGLTVLWKNKDLFGSPQIEVIKEEEKLESKAGMGPSMVIGYGTRWIFPWLWVIFKKQKHDFGDGHDINEFRIQFIGLLSSTRRSRMSK
jgi:hypothetical protein